MKYAKKKKKFKKINLKIITMLFRCMVENKIITTEIDQVLIQVNQK